MDKHTEILRISGIILAYVFTIVGVLGLAWVFSWSKSWLIGFLFLVVIIPIFPAMQSILLGEKPASPIMFLKTYAAEYASLVMQLIFLFVSAPVIVIGVAGRLAAALLVAAAISWLIVGLQQFGVSIGRKMPMEDIQILFLITLGLVVITIVFLMLRKLAKKYEDRYLNIWVNQFKKIRDFFRYG
jgi:hypothetical protein